LCRSSGPSFRPADTIDVARYQSKGDAMLWMKEEDEEWDDDEDFDDDEDDEDDDDDEVMS
jgi:hypothetical protein